MAKTVKATKAVGEIVLDLQGVHKTYGNGASAVKVLDGVDLTVRAGEAVAIVGPSGSGKSTLLHIAGLLDRPDKGTVLLGGGETKGLSDDAASGIRQRACGFVYQFHHLLREFTALENVLMPSKIGHRATPQDVERAESLLAAMGVGKRAGHYPDQLSGGEQQRVAMARALMNMPALLLADEPTGNLDPHTAEMVADMLFKLVREKGLAVLLVTHNPELAARCDRQLTMHEGRLG